LCFALIDAWYSRELGPENIWYILEMMRLFNSVNGWFGLNRDGEYSRRTVCPPKVEVSAKTSPLNVYVFRKNSHHRDRLYLAVGAIVVAVTDHLKLQYRSLFQPQPMLSYRQTGRIHRENLGRLYQVLIAPPAKISMDTVPTTQYRRPATARSRSRYITSPLKPILEI
jgi:hypothetical protein